MKENLKNVGYRIVILSVVLSVVLLSLTLKYTEEIRKACPLYQESPELCPFIGYYPLESYIGFVALLAMFGLGYYLISVEKLRTGTVKKINETVKTLKGEERIVYDIVAKEGSVFQNDLREKTNFSKVKISRILDKLEAKGIVERRRRGMSNVVVLRS